MSNFNFATVETPDFVFDEIRITNLDTEIMTEYKSSNPDMSKIHTLIIKRDILMASNLRSKEYRELILEEVQRG